MASITKLPSGLWRAQVARKGVRSSATLPTKRAAQEWAAQQEAEILAGARGEFPRKTVADALARYAREVSPTKKTGAREALRLAAFAREPWAAKLLTDLTPDDLGRWRDRRLLAVQGESIRRDFVTLSTVFGVAVREWRWMASNPVRDVRRPPPGRPRTRLPSWREVWRCRQSSIGREKARRSGPCFGRVGSSAHPRMITQNHNRGIVGGQPIGIWGDPASPCVDGAGEWREISPMAARTIKNSLALF